MNIQVQEVLPSTITDTDRKTIQNALREMSDSMTRVQAEKDLQKEIGQTIYEKVNVPKAHFNKLAKIYHASNLMEEAARNEEFMEFASAVLGGSNAKQIENNE